MPPTLFVLVLVLVVEVLMLRNVVGIRPRVGTGTADDDVNRVTAEEGVNAREGDDAVR